MARMNAPRRIALLGSTGSIGRSALEVIAALPERLKAVALAGGANVELMSAQVAAFRPALVAMATQEAAADLRQRLCAAGLALPQILHGAEGLLAVATQSGADLLLAATVGIAALPAISAALGAGCDLALANKEALVVAGRLLLQQAAATGAAILPVDSEHSAIHQCLRSGTAGEIERITLTASGGPFRRLSAAALEKVTPQQALRHP
ncbi:MAG: 1-deoxy-D-xylulose-5-phosphate reductoisomerase, partial [Terriglobales bacterium]